MIEYKPLTLTMIEEGRFNRDANALFNQIQIEHGKFVEKYGEQAEGTVSELTLTVKLQCKNVEDKLFAIQTTMKKKVPARPAKLTSAIMDSNELNEPMLWGRKSGTTEGNPHQSVLCTQDGEIVEPANPIETDEDGVIIEGKE